MIRKLALRSLALALVLGLVVPGVAFAEVGFQFGLPDRNFPDDDDVKGMRVTLLWGENRKTSGFDFGLFSVAQTDVRTGIAIVIGVSRVAEKSDGAVNLSLMNYHTGSDSGFNLALLNMVNNSDRALNVGFAQIAQGSTAIDLGALNVSKKSRFQIGFVNITQEIDGFQFGLINMADNGFLPFFPFFNYAKRAD